MDIKYVWEKFFVAVQALASGPSDVKERLFNAYISALIRLQPDDLPEEIREEFSTLQEELTKIEPTGDEGKLRATINAMSIDKAVELAKQIVSIYDEIAKRDPLNEYH